MINSKKQGQLGFESSKNNNGNTTEKKKATLSGIAFLLINILFYLPPPLGVAAYNTLRASAWRSSN
jgi:hypothetical protein